MNTFKYNGYSFIPIRVLSSNEKKMDLYSITKKHLGGYLMSRYTNKYDYDAFYKASGNSKADIFRCIETGQLYIPCQNMLSEWHD